MESHSWIQILILRLCSCENLAKLVSLGNPKESTSIWKLSALTGGRGREVLVPGGVCSAPGGALGGGVGGLSPFPLTVCDQHTKGGMALLPVLTRKQKQGTTGGHSEDNILPASWGKGSTGPGWATPPFPGGSGVWLMVNPLEGFTLKR